MKKRKKVKKLTMAQKRLVWKGPESNVGMGWQSAGEEFKRNRTGREAEVSGYIPEPDLGFDKERS